MRITFSWFLLYYQVCTPEGEIINVETCRGMINLNFLRELVL
jgi:hypothetical protein